MFYFNIGTSLLTAHAFDEDGSRFTFTLMPTDQFTIGNTSGVVEVATGATLDREVNTKPGSYSYFGCGKG